MTSIKLTTTKKQIDDYIASQIRANEAGIIKGLQYMGEECVNIARQNGSYKDQTGNLRSSTGYLVAVNGAIVRESGFNAVKQGANGTAKGKDYIHRILSKSGSGIVLIVVAGMNYAKHVAARGRDVLDSAERYAELHVYEILKRVFKP
ncbi:MAG: hypothetical protein LBK94_00780 [Prevotellaceae bacterium]|jgi:hypothetical protein|nr:hypothetical protein [Prevotellaceae bacterium]